MRTASHQNKKVNNERFIAESKSMTCTIKAKRQWKKYNNNNWRTTSQPRLKGLQLINNTASHNNIYFINRQREYEKGYAKVRYGKRRQSSATEPTNVRQGINQFSTNLKCIVKANKFSHRHRTMCGRHAHQTANGQARA